jgi:CRISPR/Cas system-associated exonuclease Cas4 (RecB family)
MPDLISHSDIDAYLVCRRKEYYGGRKRLTRKQHSDSLNRGILTHEIMAAYFETYRDTNDHAAATKAGMDALIESYSKGYDITTMAEVKRLFVAFTAKELFKGWLILDIERKVYLEIDPTLTYPFTLDLRAVDPSGRYALIDTKTTYNFYSPEQVDLLPQIPKYMGALRALGERADYGMYLQLRTREKKDETVDDIVRLTKFDPTVERLQRSFRDHVMAAKDVQTFRAMDDNDADVYAYRTANSMVCKSCSFASICISELKGNTDEIPLILEKD